MAQTTQSTNYIDIIPGCRIFHAKHAIFLLNTWHSLYYCSLKGVA